MAGFILTWMRIATVLGFATLVVSQQCYYPNGNTAPDTEKPCSSAAGSACCPDNWQCLDNGLCYYDKDKLYGRYSCTDKNWKSSGCASNLCTYGMQLGGGESITKCSNHNNNWCCNGDNQHVNCCQESPSPRPFFALQDGKPYATIGAKQASTNPNLATITGLASGTASGSSPSTAASSRAPSSATPPPSSATPFASVSLSVSSGSAGIVTVPVTVLVTPTPTASSANGTSSGSGGGSNSKIGVIIGCAVGIPLALALVGILVWILRKRRQQKANSYKNSPEMDGSDSPGFVGGAAGQLGKNTTWRHSRPNTSELDGAPIGPGRPISTIQGHAELESGTGFRPGHGTPYAPDTVGLGGGNGNNRSTWGSLPPQYSPAANQAPFYQHTGASELDSTTVMPVINEKAEHQQYQAYQPPQAPAELPTVKTPPEELEKQIHK